MTKYDELCARLDDAATFLGIGPQFNNDVETIREAAAALREREAEAEYWREERKQMAEQIDLLRDQIRDLCLRVP